MTPVEIARQALHRLAELGLAPTPENYEAQYRSLAGLPPKEQHAQPARPDQGLLEMLRALLGIISQANDGLQADLTRFSNESSTLLAQARHSIDAEGGAGAGAEMLKHLADVLQPALRETDTLARFGGEEFVLVLADTPLPAAEFTVNRLLRTLEHAPLNANGTPVTVRFSAGLAQWTPQESAEHLTTRADQAMYAAKRAGRARVVVAEEAHPA